MGRAGGGSHSGGGHFGGGHSSSRSSGGHSIGSSRAGGGSHRSSGRSSMHMNHGSSGGGFRQSPPPRHGGGFHQPPPPPRHGRSFHQPPPPRHYGGYGRRRSGGAASRLLGWVIVIIIVVLYLLFSSAAGEQDTKSTIQRTKLESQNAYINDCIVDELGWFDNVSHTEAELKDFWEETGVQPYIVLHEYDAALTSNEEKEQWAEAYYDEHFDTENIFLYVYFAEEDTDNDVGYMCYVNGYEASSVMDSEAVEIFWNYIDSYWYSDLSTDDLFIKVFDREAETIMYVSTTDKDIVKWVVILAVVVVGGITIIKVVKTKAARAKQKAEEDERILNTPINDMIKDSENDVSNKYL